LPDNDELGFTFYSRSTMAARETVELLTPDFIPTTLSTWLKSGGLQNLDSYARTVLSEPN